MVKWDDLKHSRRMENRKFESPQVGSGGPQADAERSGEARETPRARVLDAVFAARIETPGRFREEFGQRPLVAKLENARHEVDGLTIYEHTRQLLQGLRTDQLQDARFGDADIHPPDLLRVVGLYHDAEKSLMVPPQGAEADWRKPSLKEAKAASLEMAFAESAAYQPELLADPRTRVLFDELMMNGFYFGYHLDLLKREERRFDDEGEALLEKVLYQPISRLRAQGLEVEPETLFAAQFALSRADSSAIGPYKKNLEALERLRTRLLDLIN